VSIKLQIEAGMIRLSSGKPEQQQARRRCSSMPPTSSAT
jgi:hypothetical protein